jgi:hypothetical protein
MGSDDGEDKNGNEDSGSFQVDSDDAFIDKHFVVARIKMNFL